MEDPFHASLRPDIVLRMDITNRAVLDDYLLPFIDIAASNLRLAEEHGLLLQCARERDNPTAPTPTTPVPCAT